MRDNLEAIRSNINATENNRSIINIKKSQKCIEYGPLKIELIDGNVIRVVRVDITEKQYKYEK